MNERAAPLLEVSDLKVHFSSRGSSVWSSNKGAIRAVDGVSLTLRRGETLGLVGESGCGKSTLGRAVLGLVDATAGTVRFDGHEITAMTRREVQRLRPRMQLVFQDAGAALNPRWRARDLVAEPFEIHSHLEGGELHQRVDAMFETVGLDPALGGRLPRELSGGQKQRVGIARALALEPDLLVCDEPTSALDLSIQAQIINLLQDLQEQLGLSYLFIAHDLGVVRQISDRVAVMYLGKIVEVTSRDRLFEQGRHPYTQALLSAVPVADPEHANIHGSKGTGGEVPSPSSPPLGCNFCTRCESKREVEHRLNIDCDVTEPELVTVGHSHEVSCHLFQPVG